MQISSIHNPIIKNVLKLYKKRERTKQKLFIIEGLREITRALENKLEIQTLLISENNSLFPSHLSTYKPKNLITYHLPPNTFSKISYRENHDGYLAIFQQPNTDIAQLQTKFKPSQPPLFLVIESPEKPGNLGAILRTADAVQVDAIIIADPHLDLFNPNVIKASTGTFFSRPIFQTDSPSLIKLLQKKQIQIICSTPHTDQYYHQANYQTPTAIVMGAEHAGLSDTWLNNANQLIKIPMLGQADSLNLSVSTAIILFEVQRQRKFASKKVSLQKN